jgi:hypothetical protein
MQKSEKTVKCVICQRRELPYPTADDGSARLQSLDSPGGCQEGRRELCCCKCSTPPRRQAIPCSL